MAEEHPLTGTVVRVDARQCEVAVGGSFEDIQPALLRGKLFETATEDRMPVAVGDSVRLVQKDEDFAIDEILPRRNLFARRAAGEEVRRQLLSTNIDQLVIVSSFGPPPFSSITTDRILVSASFLNLPAVLVLNKIDKAKARKLNPVVETYENAGIQVIQTSATTDEGIESFASVLKQKRSVLYGLSGVGKSSLLNCVETGLGIKTKQVSTALNSGRHTTTFARLWPLSMGGEVVDTPGVRVFRPYGIPPHELRLHYPEFATVGRDCHYSGCTHRQEPDCNVLPKIESGEIPPSRHRSYLEILEELEGIYGEA